MRVVLPESTLVFFPSSLGQGALRRISQAPLPQAGLRQRRCGREDKPRSEPIRVGYVFEVPQVVLSGFLVGCASVGLPGRRSVVLMGAFAG